MVQTDKNPLAVALGRMASAKLTPAQRTRKARRAAQARWGPKKKRKGGTQ